MRLTRRQWKAGLSLQNAQQSVEMLAIPARQWLEQMLLAGKRHRHHPRVDLRTLGRQAQHRSPAIAGGSPALQSSGFQ